MRQSEKNQRVNRLRILGHIFGGSRPNQLCSRLRVVAGIIAEICGACFWNYVGHRYVSARAQFESWVSSALSRRQFLGYVVVAPLSYLCANWRALLVATSAPSLVSGIVFFCVLPESFHFVVSKGREQATAQWLKSANRFGQRKRHDLTAATIISAHHRPPTTRGASQRSSDGLFVSLLGNRRLLFYTAIFGYLWMVNCYKIYFLSSNKLLAYRRTPLFTMR